MIQHADAQVEGWIKRVSGGLPVSLAPPAIDTGEIRVSAYLMEIARRPAIREGSAPPPQQILLRYLVSVEGTTLQRAHEVLGNLIFAALEDKDFDLVLDPLNATAWTAFGVPPRPSFILCLPVRREREVTPSKRVMREIDLRYVILQCLYGRIVGPGGIPMVEAKVELSDLGLSTMTDDNGMFHFSSVPAIDGPRRLRVFAKGATAVFSSSQRGDPGNPLILRIDKLEG